MGHPGGPVGPAGGPPLGPPPLGPPGYGGGPSGSHVGVAAHGGSQSGPYGSYDPSGSAVIPQKKSKVGLVFAIIAVLAVVGGGIGFLVISSNKKDPGGADAGAVAMVDASSPWGRDAGAAVVVPDAGTTPPVVDAGAMTIDAGAPPPPVDAAPEVVDAPPPPPEVDAGPTPVPAAEVEVVFSVSPSDAKLFDGRRQLSGMRVKLDPKKSKKIVVKAAGYKSKTITVTGRDDRISVTLDKEEAPPPRLDCRSKLHNAQNAACLAEYCKHNSTAIQCGE